MLGVQIGNSLAQRLGRRFCHVNSLNWSLTSSLKCSRIEGPVPSKRISPCRGVPWISKGRWQRTSAAVGGIQGRQAVDLAIGPLDGAVEGWAADELAVTYQ